MIHGRFQPFHRGHLAYLLDAASRCSRLFVGITNPDRSPVPAEPRSPHRHLAEANPYTYVERAAMIRAALSEAKVDLRRIAIVPFPLHDPSLWSRTVPPGMTHFVRIFSPWEAEKAARLRAEGFAVIELAAPGSKEISGTQVRKLIAEGGDWRSLVPAAVAVFIEAGAPVATGEA